MFWMIAIRLRRRSVKYLSPFVKGCREESTEKSQSIDEAPTNGDKENVKDVTKKPKHRSNRKIIAQLKADSFNLDELPKDLFKESTVLQSVYMVNRAVADQFASMIAPDLKKAKSPVFEVSPGLGYLTERLLEAGVPRIHLFEKRPEFIESLKPLIAKYPDRLTIKDRDFFALAKLAYLDGVYQTKVFKEVMLPVPKHKWDDDPSLYIIGTLTYKSFLYYLSYSLTTGDLSDYGRMALYLAIPPSTSRIFSETKMTKYHRPKNILLQLLFSYEKLGTLPRRAFVPWLNRKRKNRLPDYSEDIELLHVVKLVPKVDFFHDDFTKSDAEMFFYFLLLNLRPVGTRIIPTMEKWVPNCGPRLIKMNFEVFTPFNKLSGLELLNLFKVFKSWPEYKDSAFCGIVQDLKLRR